MCAPPVSPSWCCLTVTYTRLRRLVGGLLLRELLRAAPEAFQANAAAVLPLAFGAKMDDDSDVAACWKEVRGHRWNI